MRCRFSFNCLTTCGAADYQYTCKQCRSQKFLEHFLFPFFPEIHIRRLISVFLYSSCGAACVGGIPLLYCFQSAILLSFFSENNKLGYPNLSVANNIDTDFDLSTRKNKKMQKKCQTPDFRVWRENISDDPIRILAKDLSGNPEASHGTP